MKHYFILLKRKIKQLFGYKIGYSQDNKQVYFSIPELGIQGRRHGTDIKTRMQGLDSAIPLLDINSDTTLLDAGCAEGLVSREFHSNGVRFIHGLDLQNISVEIATKLFQNKAGTHVFQQADLLDWESFIETFENSLLEQYDITLLLSVYGHMQRIDQERADRALVGLVRKTKKYFVARSTVPIPEQLILAEGFEVFYTHPAPDANQLTIYKRTK